jgi:hypothetical protein
MTLTAENGAADLWMEGYLVVLAAIVADNVETFRCFVPGRRLLGTALCASLRRHHVALVESFLFFFGEQKYFLALDTRDLNIRHRIPPMANCRRMKGLERSLSQKVKASENYYRLSSAT